MKENEIEDEKPVKPDKRDQEPSKGAKGIVNLKEEKNRNVPIYRFIFAFVSFNYLEAK